MDLGLSQATVADARARFGTKFCDGDPSGPEFYRKLTEVIERFHSTERWSGALATFRIDVSEDKNIYLPYYLENIHAAAIDNIPSRLHGQRYEFIHDGPGIVPADSGIAGAIIDRGLVGISTDFPSTAGTLTISAVAAGDAGKTIRILGYDQNGVWVKDSSGVPGELVTLAASPVTTTNQFSAIKGIQKGLTRSHLTVSRGSTVLVTLENWMTNPRFRLYQVMDSSAETVIALCKRRPIPVNYDEDYLFPGNLSAIKYGLYALDYEEQSEPDKAAQYFRNALELLNQDSAHYHGGAQEQVSYEPWGPGVTGIWTTY